MPHSMTLASGVVPPGHAAVIVHGGAGAPQAWEDGCREAAETARACLRDGGDALAAAVAAVVSMEGDGRFNAGNGASLRLDGSVEADAAVMDSAGRLGAVAGLQRVRHPVLVAREVAATPHWLLVGEGAEDFARRFGLADTWTPSDTALRRHVEVIRRLLRRWSESDAVDAALRRHWNYAVPWDVALKRWDADTVGSVVRDAYGGTAVAASTGGCVPALRGRVGDTPIIGCGFLADGEGAVAATGIGEHIVRRRLASAVHSWAASGVPLPEALDRGIASFPDDIDVGLIALVGGVWAVASNRTMPWAQLVF